MFQVLDRAAGVFGAVVGTAVGAVAGAVEVLLPAPARAASSSGERTHVEVRGVHRPGNEAAGPRLERELVAREGVRDAEVNAVLGRVVISFDPQRTGPDELARAVGEFEREAGLDRESPAPASRLHPSDPGPARRAGWGMAADLLGLGYVTVGRVLSVPVLPSPPPLIGALLGLADATPRLRREVEARLGQSATDTLFLVGGVVSKTLGRQGLGLLSDAGHQYVLGREADVRARAWVELDAQLAGRAGAHRAAPLDSAPRPVPLPDGPIEQVANRSAALAAAGYAVVLGTTRNQQRATAALQAGVPRAARLGQEGFATQISRSAATRGAVVFDAAALRRLDRVDTVVLDRSVLVTGRRVVDEVVPLDDELEVRELIGRAHELIDLNRPRRRRHRGDWTVEPLPTDRDGIALPADRATKWTAEGAEVLLLRHRTKPAGLVTVLAELDPMAQALVRAAHPAGSVLATGLDPAVAHRLGTGHIHASDDVPSDTVRELQRSGAVVAVVSAAHPAALAAADVGIGLLNGDRPPWGAHVLCPNPAAACLLLDAVSAARRASRQSAQLSVAGAALGALLSVFGPATGAFTRASVPVNTAGLLALAAGTWSGMAPGRRPPPVPAAPSPWHAMPAAAVLDSLGSSAGGLGQAESQRRRDADPDRAEAEEIGLAQASLEELANPLTPALATAAGISASIGSTVDALLIVGLLGVNALIGGAQRLGTHRELRRLTRTSARTVRVRRDSRDHQVRADDLVAGDVVELVAGDVVPADCRLLAAPELEVDESSLTGESVLAVKSTEPTAAPGLGDRHSMLYEGTVVVTGRAVAVVVATGNRTESGRTAQESEGTAPPTGVQTRLRVLAKSTVRFSIGAGLGLLAVDLTRGQGVAHALGRAVNLAVASVPEGLPFVATVAELAAARRLATRGVLTRNPSTIEALGRVDMVCFDKTGTLTEGRISVAVVSDGAESRPVDALTPPLRQVLAAAAQASPWQSPEHEVAHQTDRAVLQEARRLGVSPEQGDGTVAALAERPFESGRGYHATLSRSGGQQLLSVKGAPETVLPRCTLAASQRRAVDAEVERLAQQGHRVLVVADRATPDGLDVSDAQVHELQYRGLLALADRVRPTAARAVTTLNAAGVQVMMITGDHPGTARAIADELGLLGDRRVVVGAELDGLNDEELAALASQTGVFARVSPAQKAHIVRALQQAGRVIAVTGDGTNDAPAIRIADVGIALGSRATPAARQAADVVITENLIETIIDAVIEGRAMWTSVRDALSILLGGNLGEIGYALVTGLLSGEETLNARQLLLVNLLTDVLPAMAVAVRPPPDVSPDQLLASGPEAALGAALTRDIYLRAAATAAAAAAAWLLARPTGTPGQASTTGLVALVGAQLGQTLAVRGRTPLVAVAALGSLLLLAVAVQVPGISRIVGCRPLLPHQWGIALTAAILATAAQLLAQRLTG